MAGQLTLDFRHSIFQHCFVTKNVDWFRSRRIERIYQHRLVNSRLHLLEFKKDVAGWVVSKNVDFMAAVEVSCDNPIRTFCRWLFIVTSHFSVQFNLPNRTSNDKSVPMSAQPFTGKFTVAFISNLIQVDGYIRYLVTQLSGPNMTVVDRKAKSFAV